MNENTSITPIDLGKQVIIVASGEAGQVIGRAEYLHSERQYMLRYKAADGRAVENWWHESAIKLAD